MQSGFKLSDLVNAIILHDLRNPLNTFFMVAMAAGVLSSRITEVREDFRVIRDVCEEGQPFSDEAFLVFSRNLTQLFDEFDEAIAKLPDGVDKANLWTDAEGERRRVRHFLAIIDGLIQDELPAIETISSMAILGTVALLGLCKGYQVSVKGEAVDVPVVALAVISILEQFARNAVEEVQLQEGGAVELDAVTLADAMIFTVRDNGRGMTPTQLNQLFLGNSTKAGDHRGLGMRIAKSLAERCGYQIIPDSQPGQGTEFKLLIPL